MERLCRTLAALEESLVALERRGISLRAHAARQDPATGRLPIYHVFLGHGEHWFTTREELDEFLAKQEQESGDELKLSDETAAGGNGHEPAEGEEQRPARRTPAHRRAARSPLDQQPAGRTPQDGLRDRQPDPAGADRRRGARATCSAAARPRSAWKISAACLTAVRSGRREGPASHPFQGPGRNERRRAARHDARLRPTARSCKSRWTTPAPPTTSSAS